MRLCHLLSVASLALVPATAHAGSSGTSDSACGSSPAKTNIPLGAAFLSRGDGPVRAVLDAVGEYRTHSGVAHGNGWYTHSTTYAPGTTGWPTYCSTPADPGDLQNGYPGASQINDGALYRFYYQPGATQPGLNASGTTTTGSHKVEAFYYQRSHTNNAGTDTANWLWNTASFASVTSRQDGGNSFYRVGFTQGSPYTQYSLYQYRDYQNINTGAVPWNNGNVCSTELAYAQQQAGKGVVNNNRGDGVNTYSHARVASGLNALYASVENQCSNGTGFFEDLGAAITCFEGICDDAARQVTNCFADGVGGHCYNDSNRWQEIRDQAWKGGPVDASGMSIARSISPDNIGGWSGWGFGSAAPHSVWSWDGNQQVYWNAPGSTYGCWF